MGVLDHHNGRIHHRSNGYGNAMFQMCGVFAEFERAMIRERVNAGLARARANGKRLGRPGVGLEVEAKIRKALRKGGKGIRRIAREIGVGVSVVQRVAAFQRGT